MHNSSGVTFVTSCSVLGEFFFWFLYLFPLFSHRSSDWMVFLSVIEFTRHPENQSETSWRI